MKWDLDHQKAMKDAITRRILDLIAGVWLVLRQMNPAAQVQGYVVAAKAQ